MHLLPCRTALASRPVACVALLLLAVACGGREQTASAGREQAASAVVHEPARPAATPAAKATIAVPRPPQATALPSSPALTQNLERILSDRDGTYGIYVEHVPSGERFLRHQERAFPSASVYKLAVGVDVLRRVDARQMMLDQRVTIQPEDAEEAEPEGGVGEGETVTVEQALRAMFSVSSNAASHALMRTIGRSRLEDALRSLGLRQTRFPLRGQGVFPWSDLLQPSRAETSPSDMAVLLRLLARGEGLSASSRGLLTELLGIPEPLDPLVDAVPAQVEVLSKVGELENVLNVVGLVRTPDGPVIVVILNEDADPPQAREAIAQVAQQVLEHYSR